MQQKDTGKKDLQTYLNLSEQTIRQNLLAILARSFPQPGQRQEPFNPVEILLCYGLFEQINPHRYGGGNIGQAPEIIQTLAEFFRRPPGSITSKMLNLDGSRPHGSRLEPLLYATLADQPGLYASLYRKILQVARDISIGEETLPDFLHTFGKAPEAEALLGQYELPASSHQLLQEARAQMELERVDQAFQLGDRLTEKLVEQKVRLVQHYFTSDVLQNCGYTCVFCGFAPHALLQNGSGLLRASHIKPWAISNEQERVDLRNGLAACPMHDAAFDRGYLAVGNAYNILRASILQESIEQDQGVRPYFDDLLSPALILPESAKQPAIHYLEYHRRSIFRDG
jgi:putative restriction endonuclease